MELWLVITWAIVTVALVIAEISSIQMIAVWFAAGSFVAFLASLLGLSLFPTLVIFIIVSTVLLLFTRSFVKKVLSSKIIATNADSIIGTTCLVTEPINNITGTGRVMANGLSWAARSVDEGLTISADSECLVVAIKGVKAIVKPII